MKYAETETGISRAYAPMKNCCGSCLTTERKTRKHRKICQKFCIKIYTEIPRMEMDSQKNLCYNNKWNFRTASSIYLLLIFNFFKEEKRKWQER